MKVFRSRAVWGILLVVVGALLLLQEFDVLPFAALIWPTAFAIVGLVFLYHYLTDRARWWPLIPALALLGLAALILWSRFAPEGLEDLGAAFFMAGLGLAFWIVYFTERENWWAIIPGGVLLTIASVVGLSSAQVEFEVGGVFFLGLGLTFGLLALLPSAQGRMRWPLIPAAVLLVMGMLITAAAGDLLKYVWPAALILVGIYVVSRAFLLKR